jgi:hypothetical protein
VIAGVVALVGKLSDITDYAKLFVVGILIYEVFKDTGRE